MEKVSRALSVLQNVCIKERCPDELGSFLTFLRGHMRHLSKPIEFFERLQAHFVRYYNRDESPPPPRKNRVTLRMVKKRPFVIKDEIQKLHQKTDLILEMQKETAIRGIQNAYLRSDEFAKFKRDSANAFTAKLENDYRVELKRRADRYIAEKQQDLDRIAREQHARKRTWLSSSSSSSIKSIFAAIEDDFFK